MSRSDETPEGLPAVIAERDALRAELAEVRELADADMKALSEDSDRYIAELLAEHEAERSKGQEQVRQLEAQLETLQGTVDEHAIERYELVQQRDAAERALEEASKDWAHSTPDPAESATAQELVAELAEVRQVVAQVTAERDELLLTVESTKADSMAEQERLVAELVESHHEEVASLGDELDSVSAAVLETEQQLDAARAEVSVLEKRVELLSQAPAEESAPGDVGGEIERQLMEAEAELQRVRGENVVLQQMLEDIRGESAAPLAEPQPVTSPRASLSHTRDVLAEAEVELQPPGDDLRATLPSVDDGATEDETPELAVEEWGSEGLSPEEPVPAAMPELDYGSEALDGPVEAQPATAPAGGAPDWELEMPRADAPGPADAPAAPDWDLGSPRVSSEVTTEPPSSGDGPSLELSGQSDLAPEYQTPPPEEDPTEWQLDDEPELEVAAPAQAAFGRDQTPTAPPQRAARERQQTVPSGGDDSDGTYSFVAPRRRSHKPRD